MNIKLTTPSRLHFGLIDLNGELGRINGSFGVALENPHWIIEGYKNKKINQEIPLEIEYFNEIDKIKAKFQDHFDCDSSKINFQIKEKIPPHIGLGSKTQFSLAIAAILMKYHNLSLTTNELAMLIQRGGTSGIGVAAFDAGGIILDGGHSFGPDKETKEFLPSSISKASPPPVIFRNYPPDNWRFVVITPAKIQGSFGLEEVNLFQTECPIPSGQVEKISRLILMKILPALVEKDIKTFGEGISDMQLQFNRFGFEKYSNTIVEELLDYMQKLKEIYGFGISSFGPTIYALTNSEIEANKIITEIKDNFSKDSFIYLANSKVNSSGVKIDLTH
ncbi:MAG TPA: beta-ribofuranosylaminobenzene 5'-phosphate synthase family protein [Candidatus Bathyarchaeia archaeon]|nr:beta-ribofuranosylaminobenzene 5'-phosphate synthase family protein [Candidatus Bathyarchaeia archaeon]